MQFGRKPRGGKHLAARSAKGPAAWALAPSGLALISLVLFIVALMGNLGAGRLSGDGSPSQGTPDTRPAQAAPAQAQAPAEEQAPAQEPASAQAQVIAVESVEGERLGDIATYADGLMACVLRTRHEDAGGGLAHVSIRIKLANMSEQPIDASTARVALAFANRSSRATQVEATAPGALQPGGGEGEGVWTFRMPADQIDDISVTITPTEGHEPVTFHGASR